MAEESTVIDGIDREILGVLRQDGRIPYQTLAARVHLSANAVADRVRRLVRRGVIRRFTAEVDPAVLGLDLQAVVDVWFANKSERDRFEELLREREEILWASHVTGSPDFKLLVACAGTDGLDELLLWLHDTGANDTRTDVVLRRVK